LQINIHTCKHLSSGSSRYDLELGSGRSYYYEPASQTCKGFRFPVGILPPDWLQGSAYLGRTKVNDIECDAWTKANFIVYYADIHTGDPVRWVFLKDNMTQDVVRFHPGKAPPQQLWEVPSYCTPLQSTGTSNGTYKAG
jgi:hypothetical protein